MLIQSPFFEKNRRKKLLALARLFFLLGQWPLMSAIRAVPKTIDQRLARLLLELLYIVARLDTFFLAVIHTDTTSFHFLALILYRRVRRHRKKVFFSPPEKINLKEAHWISWFQSVWEAPKNVWSRHVVVYGQGLKKKDGWTPSSSIEGPWAGASEKAVDNPFVKSGKRAALVNSIGMEIFSELLRRPQLGAMTRELYRSNTNKGGTVRD